MTFACVKYSGLKFYYIFETSDFVFIPLKKLEDDEKSSLDLEGIFSCEYDKNSEFYVLLKEEGNFDFTLEEYSENFLYKFKLLEAIINLLFSNQLKRDIIFILEKVDSEYIIKKIFKSLSKGETEFNKTLVWKNQVIIKYLCDLVDTGFKIFNQIGPFDDDKIELKKNNEVDFALRFYFCIDMYLHGKFSNNNLRLILDLWISLEVLSVITISHILHSHESFKVNKFFDKLRKRVEKISSKICPNKIDCWVKMKDNFAEHIKNKINNFLPIRQKCIKIAENYIKVDDIKVSIKKKSEFDNSHDYQKYINGIKDFKDHQDKITLKKVIDTLYDHRNRLFHGGNVIDKWSLKFDRIKANFIKILEQLFFRVLGLETVNFYQMGYPNQKIFGLPNIVDLHNLSNKIWQYIHKYHIYPLKTDFTVHFDDLKIAKENYLDIKHDLDPLRNKFNKFIKIVLEFLSKEHPVHLITDKVKFNHVMKYNIIQDRTMQLTFDLSSEIYGLIYNKDQITIKNTDTSSITTVLWGMFDEEDIRYGPSIIARFLINPPYISFIFKEKELHL